ncbi:MAG TPA: DUF5615 family PIN-like protein [Vicinamibacterales bacterium]|nr:DUF5615 family PIN-like protein [Vicinamibacterales bacterium]
MRFLADAGISPLSVAFLNARGHDAVGVRELGLARAPDAAIVERAVAENRVILTFDLDFGDILALQVRERPSVIIFRLGNERAEQINVRLAVILAECATELSTGALVLVEDARYRIRKLPIGQSSSGGSSDREQTS